MKYRIFSKQYTVDSGEYINNKKKTQLLSCNCNYKTIKGSSPYYYYYNREKSCIKFCQDLDATACDKAPMSVVQATKSYICVDNSFNNPCGRIILFPYGFYNCETSICSTCNPIPVEDLSRNIVINNLQEATLIQNDITNDVSNNITTTDESNINIIINDLSNNTIDSEITRNNIIEEDNNTNPVVRAYRTLPKYTILDFFTLY